MMRYGLAVLLVGVVAGTSFTHHRADELRGQLSMIEMEVASFGATGASGPTGPEQSPSDKLLNDLASAPLATGATAAAMGPKTSELLPAPTATGPAARGALVTGQIAITGYTDKDFVAAAQLPFRRAIAGVLGIDEVLVKVTGIDADVNPYVSLGKIIQGKDGIKTPETIAFPGVAPATKATLFLEADPALLLGATGIQGVPALRGGGDPVAAVGSAAQSSIATVSALAGGAACRVDFSAAVASGTGRGAAKKLNAAVKTGSFMAKFVEFGATKAKAARVTETIMSSGGAGVSASTDAAKESVPEASEKQWRTGAGHWHWVSEAHLREKAAEAVETPKA